MDVNAKLAEIDALIERAKAPLSPADANREWETLQKTLIELEAEAERLKLPWGNVSEYATNLRRDFGILLGRESDGYSHEQHVSWAMAYMKRMRGVHAFGRVLEAARHAEPRL
jgi:hypothetical protein